MLLYFRFRSVIFVLKSMTREGNFEKLEQFIFDEGKIITYKTVSREFQINVNEAKQLLYEFLEDHKSENLKATYFVSGIAGESPESPFKIFVVNKKNLEKTKEILSEVTSCHVYSVSKALVVDELTLYRSDLQYNKNDEECGNYVIKHPNVEIKVPVFSKANRVKKEVKAVIPKKEGASFFKNVASAEKNKKTESTESCGAKEVPKPVENKPKTPVKNSNSESKVQKPNTLASMWQKKEDKLKKSETSKSVGNGKNVQETKQVPKNNILAMFSKQSEKKVDSSSKKSTISEPSKTSEESGSPKEKLSVKDQSFEKSKKVNETKSSVDKKKTTNQRQTKVVKNKKNTDSDDEFQPKKKKHRRICTFDDSDSESESEEAQDRLQRNFLSPEEAMETETQTKPATPSSDDEEPIPPTPPVVICKGKKKIWKNVQKTYEDEEGFFVTKQERVLVSEDDDEDPLPQSSKGNEVNKPNQFSYRKQASLTSFFKQK